MSETVPTWVTQGIRAYDSNLRLRWSPAAHTFILDRKIQNAPAGSFDALMQTLSRRNQRLSSHLGRLGQALVNDPLTETERAILTDTKKRVVYGRLDATVRLESLKEGHLFVYWVPRPTAHEPWSHRLRCILYTLRQCDLVAQGGADRVHEQMLHEDQTAEDKRESARRADFHHGSTEVYDAIQRKLGQRIILGRTRRPKVGELSGAAKAAATGG